jgi:hypothetical protein
MPQRGIRLKVLPAIRNPPGIAETGRNHDYVAIK